jgi:hypothetical protein
MKSIFLVFLLLAAAHAISSAQQQPFTAEDCGWNTFPSGLSKGYGLYSSAAIDSLPFLGKTIHVDTEPYLDRKKLSRNLVYPERAKKLGLQAILSFIVLVDEQGKASEVFAECAQGVRTNAEFREFKDSALEAIKKAVLIPAQKSGKSIQCWMRVPIVFRLY